MINKEEMLEFMKEKAYSPMLSDELMKSLKIQEKEKKEFMKLLDEMESDGVIFKNRRNRYGLPERMNLVVGRLQGNTKGFGFLISDNQEMADVFISQENMGGAMNNDKVVAKIIKEKGNGRSEEGQIIKILKRENDSLVGTFENSTNFGFVVADDKRIFQDVFIPKSEINGASTGQKVVAEIIKWPKPRRNPEGKIVEILGNKGDPGVDILSVIRKYDLPEDFTPEIEEAADSLPDTIPKSEYLRRRDLRDVKMVTIDGEDAKDLDDAVSVKKLPNGNYLLGVHIADVSFYVRENDLIDREAQKRGTSVYLINRVVPMLPKKLSNGICSLNPQAAMRYLKA